MVKPSTVRVHGQGLQQHLNCCCSGTVITNTLLDSDVYLVARNETESLLSSGHLTSSPITGQMLFLQVVLGVTGKFKNTLLLSSEVFTVGCMKYDVLTVNQESLQHKGAKHAFC